MRVWKLPHSLLLVVLACLAALQLVKLAERSSLARERIELGSSLVSGDCEAGADGFVISRATEELKLAAWEIPLRSFKRYLIEFNARRLADDAPPTGTVELAIDLFRPDYDRPEQQRQVSLPASAEPARIARVIDSGEDAPERVHLRLMTFDPARVEVSGLRVFRLRKAHAALEGCRTLVLLAGIVGGAYVVFRRSRDLGLALLVAGTVGLVSSACIPFEAYDTLWNVPVALSILTEGNMNLNEFLPRIIHYNGWATEPVGGNWYNHYPPGISLVALPAVLIGKLLVGTDIAALDLLAARSLFALLGFLFYFLLRERGVSRRRALVAALLFCLATSNLSVLSGALWTHTGIQLLLVIILLLLVRAEKSSRPGRILPWAGLPVGLLYTVRPNAAVLILCISAYVCWRHRRAAAGYIASAGVVLAAFFLWSLSVFQTLRPPYYQMKLQFDPLTTVANLAGLMVSPNRGLLIFTPLALFAILGAWVVLRRGSAQDRVLTVTMLLYVAALACWPYWWGGESYGPRLLCDLNPILALLAVEGFAREEQRHRRFALGFLVLAGLFGLFVQLRGATSEQGAQWNKATRTPATFATNVDRRPERCWDWSDLQFLRGL